MGIEREKERGEFPDPHMKKSRVPYIKSTNELNEDSFYVALEFSRAKKLDTPLTAPHHTTQCRTHPFLNSRQNIFLEEVASSSLFEYKNGCVRIG